MKTVFDNRQVAHVWAQQRQEEGRGSNFYFEGPTIYSYGRHFPIASFRKYKGRTCVLFTSDKRSISTSRHISYARQAIPRDVPVFIVADTGFVWGNEKLPASVHNANKEHYKARIASVLETAARSRSPARTLQEAMDARAYHAEANAYAQFFGLTWRLRPPKIDEKALAVLREKYKAASKKLKEERKRKEAEAEAYKQQSIAEWRKGEGRTPQFAGSIYADDAILRYNSQQRRVETSKGAHVPGASALRACRIIMNGPTSWGDSHGEGAIRVGEFLITAVRDNKVIAGCHRIPMAEVIAMRETLETALRRGDFELTTKE